MKGNILYFEIPPAGFQQSQVTISRNVLPSYGFIYRWDAVASTVAIFFLNFTAIETFLI